MTRLTQETLREADTEQVALWYAHVFKGISHALDDVICALEEHERPVIRYWNVYWIRRKGYYQAEVSNLLMRHHKLINGGRQGFGWGDSPEEALMEAALDWYLRVRKPRKQKA